MLALITTYRRLIACLAIALQVLGAVVGGLGHSHHGDAPCCTSSLCRAESKPHCHHGSKCSHGHDHAAAASPTSEPASSDPSPTRPHDDCSLCRHFSQPVSPATWTVEVPRCERVEVVIFVAPEPVIPAARPPHPARGPPPLSV